MTAQKSFAVPFLQGTTKVGSSSSRQSLRRLEQLLLDFIRSNTSTTPFKISRPDWSSFLQLLMSLSQQLERSYFSSLHLLAMVFGQLANIWSMHGKPEAKNRRENRDHGSSNDHLKRHKIASSTLSLSLRSISWSLLLPSNFSISLFENSKIILRTYMISIPRTSFQPSESFKSSQLFFRFLWVSQKKVKNGERWRSFLN